MKNIYQANANFAVDYFEMFPDELILYIFQFLPNYEALLNHCFQVCRRWRRLCADPTLWRIVSLSRKDKIKIKKLVKVLSFGVQRLEIKYSTWEESENQQMKNDNLNIIQYNDLRHISLNYSGMAADIFANLLSNCFNLTEVILYGQEINDAAYQHIAKNKNLTTLELSSIFGNVTALGISKILNECTSIRHIAFYNSNFSEAMFTTIFHSIPNSSAIQFMLLGNSKVFDKHIQTITVRCPDLMELNLLFCTKLTSSSLKFIVNGLKNLRYLLLCCNDSLLPKTLLQLRCLRKLTDLEILSQLKEPFPIEIKDELKRIFCHVEIFE